MSKEYDPFVLDRMVAAVNRVEERLLCSTAALAAEGVPYAVVGGNAVMWWVGTVEPAGIRYTPDVDLLVDGHDLDRAMKVLAAAGCSRSLERDALPRNSHKRNRDDVHLVVAGEFIRPTNLTPMPGVDESVPAEKFQVVGLESLVRMKLSGHRTIDRVHIRDMMDVGLIDATWPGRFPPEYGERLQHLLDTPDG